MSRKAGSKPTFRVLHHLARSGGTLISKCIASMQGVTLLSEVHPRGTAWTKATPPGESVELYGLYMQALDHGLLSDAQLKQYRRRPVPFANIVAMLGVTASSRGDSLVLRDFTHLDYTGYPWFEPTHTSGLVEALSPMGSCVRFSTTRHPIDQWNSLLELDYIKQRRDKHLLTAEKYLAGYAAFAEVAREHGFVRYEDFTHDPGAHLRTICDGLEIEYDDGWRERWSGYTKITGDTTGSRGGLSEIRPLERRPAEPKLLEAFRTNDDYRKIKDLLGYTDELD